MRKRVGIFGGSFNPPHKGHVEICRYFLDSNDVDEIWVVPCFKHAFNKELAPFEDRLMMCKFAFGGLKGRVRVMDVEKKMGGVSFTVQTIEHLLKDNPECRFFLVLGSDTAKESPQWKDFDKIRELVSFLTVPRGPASFIPNISSTEIRRRIRTGQKFIDMVTRDVTTYIVTKGLYG